MTIRRTLCSGTVGVLLCLGAACTSHPVTGPNQPPKDPVHFSCAGGKNIAVRFGNGSAVLETGGEGVAMIQTRTADGFRYAGGGQVLRGKGRELRWHDGSEHTLLCHAVTH